MKIKVIPDLNQNSPLKSVNNIHLSISDYLIYNILKQSRQDKSAIIKREQTLYP